MDSKIMVIVSIIKKQPFFSCALFKYLTCFLLSPIQPFRFLKRCLLSQVKHVLLLPLTFERNSMVKCSLFTRLRRTVPRGHHVMFILQ